MIRKWPQIASVLGVLIVVTDADTRGISRSAAHHYRRGCVAGRQ